MKCQVCSSDKLRREFIPYSASDQCHHPPYVCLRCVTAYAKKGKNCPYPGCKSPLSSDMVSLKEFENLLNIMFREIDEDSECAIAPIDDPSNTISVVRLTGESNVFAFTPIKTVSQLKDEIQAILKIECSKQELLYRGKEIEEYNESTGEQACLTRYGIKPGSQIILMVLLYAIPSTLNEVTFDLSWNYPARKKDYLDATCLVFNGRRFKTLVDFSRSYMAPASAERLVGVDEKRGRVVSKYSVDESQISIKHTSDKHMDDLARKGKHTIIVHLKRLPKDVTDLFFVLSAWEHPTIAHFPNPSLKFYETSRPSVNLCETTFTHALNSSAVIMCSVTRKGNAWQIRRSGALSSGNAKDYQPMKQSIKDIIGMSHEVGVASEEDDSDKIEIAFSFDTTGSMYSCLDELRTNLQHTIRRLLKDIPNIRIALIAHGDYCDCADKYVVRMLDFTNDMGTLVNFAQNTPSTSGGDCPECYEWVLHEASRLSWSAGEESSKSLVVIGDDIPHPPSMTDQWINWRHEMKVLKEKSIKIFGVQANQGHRATPFYQMISEYTGGAYIDFNNFQAITDMFLALCYKCAGEEQFARFHSEVRARGGGSDEVINILQQIAKAGMMTSEDVYDRWRVNEPWWNPEKLDRGSPKYCYNKYSQTWRCK